MKKKDAIELELGKGAVRDYWRRKDPRLSQVVAAMEEPESWTMSDVELIEKAWVQLGETMATVDHDKIENNNRALIELMAYMPTGKSLRILNWMDQVAPGMAMRFIMEAKHLSDWEPGKLMIDRLHTMHCINMMGRVFSPRRSAMITRLLDS